MQFQVAARKRWHLGKVAPLGRKAGQTNARGADCKQRGSDRARSFQNGLERNRQLRFAARLQPGRSHLRQAGSGAKVGFCK
jgi:hypothetical protein